MNQNQPTKQIFLGAIADDVTGASDLAINLVKGGLRVVQFLGIPTARQLDDLDCDAVVVALKTRSIPADDAIEQTLVALQALRAHRCQRFYFKYCSTFDSTPGGNIGQVASAMLDALDSSQTILCPAFPRANRTVYQGHLFVGDRLLNDSGMQHHPLNPMTDADIVRFCNLQTDQNVGLVDLQTVTAGSDAIKTRLAELAKNGTRLVVTDCCSDTDLKTIAQSTSQFPLITGGSGLGRFLPHVWRKDNLINPVPHLPALTKSGGKVLIIAGSCSTATQAQVAYMEGRCQIYHVDAAQLLTDSAAQLIVVQQLAQSLPEGQALMVASTTSPEKIKALREQFNQATLSAAVEKFHADVAEMLVREHRFNRLLIAGGETSGSIVERLEIERLFIGPEICTGVPWTETRDDLDLALALKSGNFGDEQFFQTAIEMLHPQAA